MSVKHGLLALLSEGPMYGAQLRSQFEMRTGGTWPLNIGQVYTTLGRLERDGLVEPAPDADMDVAEHSAAAERRILYRLTEAGRESIQQWWVEPIRHEEAPRQELTIKLALAVTVPGIDVPAIVQTQRVATLRHLRDLTTLKRSSAKDGADRDLAWLLVNEKLIFSAEAELRWLDHVEGELARRARAPRPTKMIMESDDTPVETVAGDRR